MYANFFSRKHDLARSCFQLWAITGDKGEYFWSYGNFGKLFPNWEANYDAGRGLLHENDQKIIGDIFSQLEMVDQ